MGILTSKSISAQTEKLIDLISFLETQNTSAKDYVLEQFDKFDIVILQERDHRELTQYDLILDIVSDPRFINYVGNIHMEVGTRNSFSLINGFLQKDSLTQNEITKNVLQIIRNNDFEPIWEKYNYPYFLENLYTINQTLPQEKKITIYPSDMSFSWEKTRTAFGYYIGFIGKNRIKNGAYYRDVIMGENIVKDINSVYNDSTKARKKHLVIMNAPHAYVTTKKSASGWIKEAFPKKTMNIYIGTLTRHAQSLIEDGKWDAAFKYCDKTNIGFNLDNTPFGQTQMAAFTMNSEHKSLLQNFFNGFIYYKPIEKQVIAYGYPDFIDENFQKELRRRNRIRNPFSSYKKANWEQYNTIKKEKYVNIEFLKSQREQWNDSINIETIIPSP